MSIEVTDTETITITIIQHGLAVIENLDYPSQVEVGEEFTITYDCKNTGTVTDTLFGRMKDGDGAIIPDSEWQEEIGADSSVSKTKIFTAGITEDLTITLEVGHI